VEKLLTYALGRGVEYEDMPLVRSIAREVSPNARFSALVMGIVKSPPFQMNTKFEQDGEPAGATASRASNDRGGQ
jgi:hypothetical protein